MLVLTYRDVKPSGRVLRTRPRFLPQRSKMVAAVGSEKDKQSALNYTTALQTNSPVFSHDTTYHGICCLYIYIE